MSPGGNGAENRVGDGVRENVGVGMPGESELRRNRDAAENQRTAGGDAVNVPALPDTGMSDARRQRRAVSCSKNSRARSISLGRVILMLRSLPRTTLISTWSSRSTRLASSVPEKLSRARGFERAPQNVVAENLRSLRQNQALAGNSRAHFRAAGLRAADLLDGVDGNNPDDRRAAQLRLPRSLGEWFRDPRTGRTASCTATMIGIGIERRKRFLHRFLPRIAARHHAQGAEQAAAFFLQHFLDPLDFLFAHRDHDIGHERRRDELAHRVHQNGRAFEQHELLAAGSGCLGGDGGDTALHPGAEAGCRQNNGESSRI